MADVVISVAAGEVYVQGEDLVPNALPNVPVVAITFGTEAPAVSITYAATGVATTTGIGGAVGRTGRSYPATPIVDGATFGTATISVGFTATAIPTTTTIGSGFGILGVTVTGTYVAEGVVSTTSVGTASRYVGLIASGIASGVRVGNVVAVVVGKAVPITSTSGLGLAHRAQVTCTATSSSDGFVFGTGSTGLIRVARGLRSRARIGIPVRGGTGRFPDSYITRWLQ